MTKNEGFDARAVANFLLDLADRHLIELSNLHLQKVIYFAHGNYHKQFHEGLVINRFEAWEHGPVVSELYHSLKSFGDGPVLGRAKRFDFLQKQFVEVRESFSAPIPAFLEEILLFYGRMDPWELVKLSHRPGGAWDLTMKASRQRANFALVMKEEVIATCFGSSHESILQ